MPKLSPQSVSLLLFAAVCGPLQATGDYGSSTVLEGEGQEITGTPEFFWELECKRIATEFVPEEKRVMAPTPAEAGPDEQKTPPNGRELFTTDRDLEDFRAALKDESLKPADPNAATASHAAAREVVKDASSTRTDGVLPAEAPGEFALYHQGALAYKTRHAEQATAAWAAILAKPAAERKYRSTWAAYMLGRSALDEHEFAKAADFFQQTRKLAKEGCVDSLGLAAESYGWEARCELELGHSENSARLYLNQLAAGDPSAVVSLKWFIPDWGRTVKGEREADAKPGVGDGENEEGVAVIDPGPTVSTPRGEKALADAARSLLLRRLVSAHILATAAPGDAPYSDPNEAGAAQKRWLEALDQAGVKDTQDAEYIGWVAYSAGKYEDANHWLAKSSGTSVAALWLKAKFALREGNLAEGTKLLSQALRVLPQHPPSLENTVHESFQAPSESANGELGVLQLAQSDFIQALDAFIAADMWEDAAYIAERCLTKVELLEYVRQQKFTKLLPQKPPGEEAQPSPIPNRLRDLVARRMMREDDYQTAREFFTPDKIALLDDYTTALAKGVDKSIPKQQQARALFHAAWIARYKGMELMGTEVGPDSTMSDGAFSDGDLAMERLTGKRVEIEDMDRETEEGKPPHFPLPVSPQEKERLRATRLVVERRFHYRHVAAGLAWKAAELLPDNTKETADVLNSAESWLVDRSPKQAERFSRAYAKRCTKVMLGKKAGPWSNEESKLLPP